MLWAWTLSCAVAVLHFPTNHISGSSLTDLFQDPQCPQVDGRAYLSSQCQQLALQVNQTLGVTLDRTTESLRVRDGLDQSVLDQWCGSCASNISSWMRAYNETNSYVCQLNEALMSSICTVDPVSKMSCVKHMANYAYPTVRKNLLAAIALGADYAFLESSACKNLSCCEMEALDEIVTLGNSNSFVARELIAVYESFQKKIISVCGTSVNRTCTSLLVQTSQNADIASSSSGMSSDYVGAFVAVFLLLGIAGVGGFVYATRRSRGNHAFEEPEGEAVEDQPQTLPTTTEAPVKAAEMTTVPMPTSTDGNTITA